MGTLGSLGWEAQGELGCQERLPLQAFRHVHGDIIHPLMAIIVYRKGSFSRQSWRVRVREHPFLILAGDRTVTEEVWRRGLDWFNLTKAAVSGMSQDMVTWRFLVAFGRSAFKYRTTQGDLGSQDGVESPGPHGLATLGKGEDWVPSEESRTDQGQRGQLPY